MKRNKNQHGLTVYIDDNQSFQKALSKFKRKIKQSGKLQQLKQKSQYTKPSVIKRRKIKLGKLKAFYKQKQ